MNYVSGIEEQINCSQNYTGSSRTGTVRLVSTNGSIVFATCQVTQEASEPYVTWDLPATLTFEGGGDGAIFNITDSNNVGWRLTFPDWCFVNNGGTEGSGDRYIDFVARINYTGSSRTGTVQLVSTDGNTVYATCIVTQEAYTSAID